MSIIGSMPKDQSRPGNTPRFPDGADQPEIPAAAASSIAPPAAFSASATSPATAMPPSSSSLVVAELSGGQRLDRFLVEAQPKQSRARWKELIAAGLVMVNGRPARKSLVVQAGWLIELPIFQPAPAIQDIANPDLMATLNILYQDADLIAVDKPAGMPTHPLHGAERATLFNALLAFDPAIATAGPKPWEGGLVHRLDIQTSGLILAARRPAAFAALKDCFTRHAAEKTYLALVLGELAQNLDISLALAHHGQSSKRMVALDLTDQLAGLIPRPPESDSALAIRKGNWRGTPRPALSQVQVLQHLSGHTLVAVRVRQAQMHQIRAHLHAIGHPLAADAIYKRVGGNLPDSGMQRHALHAWRLSMPHPITGEPLQLEAPLASDMVAAIQRLGGHWPSNRI